MGKCNGNKNRIDTKVLYKKSNITIRTHSRSCSDASQITKSGILQFKKNLSKSPDYYTDGDKVKRDLSVETGVCVLRRYYKSKHKRDRCSLQASSAKSKCSTVPTEFAEFKPDHGCGDSRNKFEIVDTTNALNIDITSLMVENLKSLLNDWIRKHVLEDTDTKKKLIDVLDSIMQSLETKVPSTRSSCCTYVVERNGEGYTVRNKKTETNSLTCQYCKQKQTSLVADTSSSVLFRKFSRFTIPFPYKHLRIISTLSIPRNMNKKEKCKKKQLVYKVKKVQKKDVSLANSKKERKVVINISSCAMSTVSQKNHDRKSPSKKRGIIFLPQMFYKSTTDVTSTTEMEDDKRNEETQENQFDAMPSLVKSIYADDPANVTSTDKIVNYENTNDNFTMTETKISNINTRMIVNSASNVHFHEAEYECCKRTMKTSKITNKRFESHTKIDFIDQSIEFPNLTITKRKSLIKQSKKDYKITNCKLKSRKSSNKTSRRRKSFRKIKSQHESKSHYESIKYKQFTYLYKKAKNRILREGDFLNHFRNIFKYFANHEGKRNIKLEIHCNVYPFFDIEENYSDLDRKTCPEYEINMNNTDDCNIVHESEMTLEMDETCKQINESPKLNAEIIPLLDGAASQAKYIFKSDNSTSTSNHSIKYPDNTEKGTLMTSLEVSKELSELKTAIKDFSVTAEKLVNEHLKNQNDKSIEEHINSSNKDVVLKSSKNIDKRPTKLSNTSKGIQFSNTTKGQPLSGIKLSKGPKKTEEATNRLKKRSSSYHVIDSESILRVTDMTASANKSKDSTKPCKLKKSKSLLNITNEANRQKLLAFFGNSSRKNNNDRIVYKVCQPNPSFSAPTQVPPCNNPCCKSRSPSKLLLPVNVSDYQGCGHDYCSSVYVDIDKPTITVKKKSGLPWWEGLIYCILLWIPVIVVLVLFYDYVLKDFFSKPQNSTVQKTTTARRPKLRMNSDYLYPSTNSSQFLLKLADFGF